MITRILCPRESWSVPVPESWPLPRYTQQIQNLPAPLPEVHLKKTKIYGLFRFSESGNRVILGIRTSKIRISKHMLVLRYPDFFISKYQNMVWLPDFLSGFQSMLRLPDFHTSISGLLWFDYRTFCLDIEASGYRSIWNWKIKYHA